jgi:hypothetical protein
MNTELELIEMVEMYLAQVSYYNELKFQYGRATQQKDKVATLRRQLKAHIGKRRLAIADEEKRKNQPPQQNSLFNLKNP